MITTGVTGHTWRASITPWGAIEPWDGSPTLDWYVAADDRWHVPAEETAVRQTRIDGTAVTETRVRVPRGDVVQRVWSVADHRGLTVIEVENESTMPVAIAFGHRDVRTERPIGAVPIEGIDLPDEAFVLPLGHRARLRVAIPHDGSGAGPLPAGLPAATQVVGGWLTLTGRASRFALPDGERGAALAATVTGERCEVALGAIPALDDDPAGFAIALAESVRMGERPDRLLPELVVAVERLGPTAGWDADVALDAAARILVAADERRARDDLRRIVDRRRAAPPVADPPAGVRAVAWLERSLACGGAVLPAGLPAGWLGQPIEVHGVPTGDTSTVSYAIRWHGARPAVLWEQSGGPVELTSPVVAPGWRSDAVTGETLWPAPGEGAPPQP